MSKIFSFRHTDVSIDRATGFNVELKPHGIFEFWAFDLSGQRSIVYMPEEATLHMCEAILEATAKRNAAPSVAAKSKKKVKR